VKPDTKIKETSATGGSGQLQFSLTNDGSWPVGEYKVELFLNDQEKPARTLAFKVQ
jgi:outer membrane usher protein FimD/PapC